MWDERTTNEHQRHQSGKTYSLVEMKFRRDKNWTKPTSRMAWQRVPNRRPNTLRKGERIDVIADAEVVQSDFKRRSISKCATSILKETVSIKEDKIINKARFTSKVAKPILYSHFCCLRLTDRQSSLKITC